MTVLFLCSKSFTGSLWRTFDPNPACHAFRSLFYRPADCSHSIIVHDILTAHTDDLLLSAQLQLCSKVNTQDPSDAGDNTPPVGRHSRQRQPLRPQVLTNQHPPPRQPNPSTTNTNQRAPPQQENGKTHRPAPSQEIFAYRGDARDSLPVRTSSVRGRGHLIRESNHFA